MGGRRLEKVRGWVGGCVHDFPGRSIQQDGFAIYFGEHDMTRWRLLADRILAVINTRQPIVQVSEIFASLAIETLRVLRTFAMAPEDLLLVPISMLCNDPRAIKSRNHRECARNVPIHNVHSVCTITGTVPIVRSNVSSYVYQYKINLSVVSFEPNINGACFNSTVILETSSGKTGSASYGYFISSSCDRPDKHTARK